MLFLVSVSDTPVHLNFLDQVGTKKCKKKNHDITSLKANQTSFSVKGASSCQTLWQKLEFWIGGLYWFFPLVMLKSVLLSNNRPFLRLNLAYITAYFKCF